MYKNNTKYNKLYRNGILYDKAFCNGKQILGVDPSLLLDIPFETDYQNKVAGGIQMEVAGGSPTFANGAAVFNGSQSIKTATPLDIGTDKVTVCFWIKTSQSTTAIISELSEDNYYNNAFAVLIGAITDNTISLLDRKNLSQSNYSASLEIINNNEWKHIACIIDRTSNQYNIHINGVLSTQSVVNDDINGNWDAAIFYIGQRGGVQSGFNGELKKIKLFNRELTQQEINELMLL